MLIQIPGKLASAWRRRSIRDAAAIVGICLATYIAANSLELFDQIFAFIKRYDAYDLDELIVVAFVFGVLMLIYALRRARERTTVATTRTRTA